MKSGKWMSKLYSFMDFLKEELYMMQPEVFVNPKGVNKNANSSDPSMDWCKHLGVGIYALIS